MSEQPEQTQSEPQQPSSLTFKQVAQILLGIVVVIYFLNKYGIIHLSSLFKSNDETYTSQSYQSQQSFNTSDASIQTNGNLKVAIRKILNMTPIKVWQNANVVTAAKITRSPYSSIGKLFKLKGQVYKIEEFPPTKNIIGQWNELLMMVDDSNSPLGFTTVSFMYNGDIENINSNDYITCAGYFIGTYESKNALGGTVECLVIVGNIFKKLY